MQAHYNANMMFGHKIPLVETDPFESLPVTGPFLVQCDECGQEHSYDPGEVLRIEMSTSETFTTHRRTTEAASSLSVAQNSGDLPGFMPRWWPIGSATLGFEGEYPYTH